MNELIKRVIVGIIGIPLGLIIIYLGSYYFFGAILIISVIALWEFFRLVFAKGYEPQTILGIITLVIIECTFYSLLTIHSFTFFKILNVLILEILFFYLILFGMNLFYRKKEFIVNISTTMGGLIYIAIPFISLLILRSNNGHENSDSAGFFIIIYFVSIWICDSAAYFIGKKWGKNKIAIEISPKKSWEGGIAGLIASIITFSVLGYFMKLPYEIYQLLIFGIIIGSIGQIGDFLESSFKRDAKVKDSSNLLSEHGGILDRFDSIIYTAPAVLLLKILFTM